MRRTLPAFALAVSLALAACSGGGSPAPATSGPSDAPSSAAAEPCTPSSNGGTVDASIIDFEFDPPTIQASVGDVVTWTNDGAAPHTATLSEHPACTTPELAAGEGAGIQFSEPGTYAFFCTVHPTMTGSVEVSG